jgi:hypothetical protein
MQQWTEIKRMVRHEVLMCFMCVLSAYEDIIHWLFYSKR